jgi:predicted  nucleic acid-binding Zn-ribbon protein
MVGELRALITADSSDHARKVDAAQAKDKAFKRAASADKAKIDADETPFVRATERSVRAAGMMRAKVGNFVGELRGEFMAVGAVAAVVGGLKAAVMAASDLSESSNQVSVTFGAAQQKVFDFASTASKSIGQSNVEARQAAATFGIYAKQAGMAGQQSAEWSISLVKLASDMASFRNTTPAEAIEAIGAAFRGESDPIEKYGVLINESVLAQRALKMGVIQTTTQALTPQQRVLVAHQEILAQTKSAQGDFGRTSGELANQLRTLRAKVIDQAAAFGNDLLPAAKQIVSFLSGPGMDAFSAVADILKAVFGVVGDVAGAFADLPAPVQAGLAALVAWRLVQSRITDGASNMADKLTMPWRRLGDEIRLQQALLTGSSQIASAQIGRVGLAMAALESRSPGIARMADAYRTWSARVNEVVRAHAAMAGGLGGLNGQLTSAGRALDNAALAAGRFAGGVVGFGAAAGSALKTGLGSLVNFLGGPWGVAIMAASALIGIWISRQQEAKRQQEASTQAAKAYAQALRETNGVITESIRKQAAQRAEQQGALAQAKTLGLSLSTVTDAVLGQGEAFESLRSRLRATVEAHTSIQKVAVGSTAGGYTFERSMDAQGKAAFELLQKLGGLRDEWSKGTSEERRLAEALGETSGALQGQTAASGPLRDALKVVGDASKTAQDKVSALKTALDELSGKRHTVEEATQAVNDEMRDMATAFTDAAKASKESKTALVDQSGAINTLTEKGSNLQDKVMSLSDAFRSQFSAIVENETRLGKSLPDATATAAAATQGLRDKLMDLALKATGSEAAAKRLVDRYDLFPQELATEISQPGMVAAQSATDLLRGKVLAVPNNKTVITSALTAEALTRLTDLGFTVRQLPNGRIEVTAATDSAFQSARAIVATINGMSATIRVTSAGDKGNSQGQRFIQGSGDVKWNASGQVMKFFAGGGIQTMSASSAAIVAPYTRTGVLRVIADNPVANELFLPLIRSSARSQALLDEGIKFMRPDVYAMMKALPMAGGGIVAAGAGGQSIPAPRAGGTTNNYYINEPTGRSVTRAIEAYNHEREVLYGA